MTIPNLAGVIKKDDIYQKGGGSFKASYVAWAKTSQLLREHAPGWQFLLCAKTPEEYVWPAPDGTGYLMCCFQKMGADLTTEESTTLFPFPIMDNRNMPVKLEKISSRILTDSHRRALCACAAFTFGLAYELWADEEVLEAGAQPENPKPKTTTLQAINKQLAARTHNTPPPKDDGSLKKTFLAFVKNAKSVAKLDEYESKLLARYEKGDITEDDKDEIQAALITKKDELEL